MKRLTKKEKGFVKDFVKTDNATFAAINNYDIQSDDMENVAGVIGSELLRKPKILKAIADMLPDELLGERHLELINKREIVKMFNGEGQIIDQPDTQAVSKGLDMAYKIKGSYAPEKSETKTFNVNVNSTPNANELRELAMKVREQIRKNYINEENI